MRDQTQGSQSTTGSGQQLADAANAPRRVLVWNDAGQIVLDLVWTSRSLSLASAGDVDRLMDLPDGVSVILTFDDEGGLVRTVCAADGASDGAGTASSSGDRFVRGCPHVLLGLNWLITSQASTGSGERDDAVEDSTHGVAAVLIPQVIDLVARPMQGAWELRKCVREFCTLVTGSAHASNGMLVVNDHGSMIIAATHGLDAKAAQELWEAMPKELAAGILRSRARMILPEAFRERSSATTTIFVGGVQSVAGFPILAEGKLLGILYLGFSSLVRDLTPVVESGVTAAAALLGLVMQRAQLRDDLNGLLLSGARKEDSGANTNRMPRRLMVGSSAQVSYLYRMIARLAPVDVSVLIHGETGTGKELVARELHRGSGRAAKPFVVVNAAAIPESLAEAELFGHRKGAFTGAISDRVGLLEQASGGTLFLDEIGELPLAVQAKLLRALQERKITRVGDTQERSVNFRLIAATHRDLQHRVKAGQFREDLYYRIAGATIVVAPLRERREDILQLADTFKTRFVEDNDMEDKCWSPGALQALEAYDWPGNVRELENLVTRAFVMSEGETIDVADLGLASAQALNMTSEPGGIAGGGLGVVRLPGAASPSGTTLEAAKDAWMRAFLVDALRRHSGRRLETAKALGIGERTLFRYLDQLGIRDV